MTMPWSSSSSSAAAASGDAVVGFGCDTLEDLRGAGTTTGVAPVPRRVGSGRASASEWTCRASVSYGAYMSVGISEPHTTRDVERARGWMDEWVSEFVHARAWVRLYLRV